MTWINKTSYTLLARNFLFFLFLIKLAIKYSLYSRSSLPTYPLPTTSLSYPEEIFACVPQDT